MQGPILGCQLAHPMPSTEWDLAHCPQPHTALENSLLPTTAFLSWGWAPVRTCGARPRVHTGVPVCLGTVAATQQQTRGSWTSGPGLSPGGGLWCPVAIFLVSAQGAVGPDGQHSSPVL